MKYRLPFVVFLLSLAYATPLPGNQAEPVIFSNIVKICDGCLANGLTNAYTVPAEKVLVIEHVSVRVSDLADGDSVDTRFSTYVDGTRFDHYLGIAEPVVRSKIDGFSHPDRMLSRPLKTYADPETTVGLHANRLSRVGQTWVRYSFSGYLVHVDAGLSPPTDVDATDGAYADRVRVTFSPVTGATVYRIFRCSNDDYNCGAPIGFPTTGSFDDTKGNPGTVYYYRVRACMASICGDFSDSDAGHR